MCATSRKIELSVKPITCLSQIYFGGTRRGSDKISYSLNSNGKAMTLIIVMDEALSQDKNVKHRLDQKNEMSFYQN